MRVREYGASGRLVLVLHGGPGAPGHMAPVARGLAGSFRVLEPWQRASGGVPLSVARHVEDLHDLVTSRRGRQPPALVGSSWGAMLALAYAAEYPEEAGPLALVGCGTFDLAARERLHATVESRMPITVRKRIERLTVDIPDPDERLRIKGDLLLPLYSYDLLTTESETEAVDSRAHEETWADMLRLQADGTYPAAFAAITVPVIMLHGAQDPHPGRMIRATLQAHLPQLEYKEWKRCGHYPWLERHVRGEFFAALRDWLDCHLDAVRLPAC